MKKKNELTYDNIKLSKKRLT